MTPKNLVRLNIINPDRLKIPKIYAHYRYYHPHAENTVHTILLLQTNEKENQIVIEIQLKVLITRITTIIHIQ